MWDRFVSKVKEELKSDEYKEFSAHNEIIFSFYKPESDDIAKLKPN